MTGRREREALVEAAAGAWRPRRHGGGVGTHPAWADLDEAGRREAYELARVWRRLEAALDARGASTTVKAVMGKIRSWK